MPKYEDWIEYRKQEEDRPPTLREEMMRLRGVFRELDSYGFDVEYCVDHDEALLNPPDPKWSDTHRGCCKFTDDQYSEIYELGPAIRLLDYLLDYSE